jgi:hypothetical protein
LPDPAAGDWRVHPDKILRYLLSDTTATAAAKNRFFRSAGYTPEAWRALESALTTHPASALLHKSMTTIHGERRVYRCDMPRSPNGGRYGILSVWEQRSDGAWWLVTAYPQGR